MSAQVCNGSLQAVNAVGKQSKANVASSAQDSAHCIGFMAMVDVDGELFAYLWKGFLANCTQTTLSRHQSCELIKADTVAVLISIVSNCLGIGFPAFSAILAGGDNLRCRIFPISLSHIGALGLAEERHQPCPMGVQVGSQCQKKCTARPPANMPISQILSGHLLPIV